MGYFRPEQVVVLLPGTEFGLCLPDVISALYFKRFMKHGTVTDIEYSISEQVLLRPTCSLERLGSKGLEQSRLSRYCRCLAYTS